jgi:indolepyruvate ferredoxin oxidoreductase
VADTVGQLAVPDDSRRDFALRVYDLVQYADLDYARRYADAVLEIQRWDSAERGYDATKAVIWNLHKVMLIKDEIYVAHLLTSEEKRRRDRSRYNIDPQRGDRLEYRHINRPQFTFWGRNFAWDMKTRDWMLDLLKHMRWLRRVLPDWHRPEKEFRDWYQALLPRFREAAGESGRYNLFVGILRLPESVTGYREIRYPKMRAAEAQAEAWLGQLATMDTRETRWVNA